MKDTITSSTKPIGEIVRVATSESNGLRTVIRQHERGFSVLLARLTRPGVYEVIRGYEYATVPVRETAVRPEPEAKEASDFSAFVANTMRAIAEELGIDPNSTNKIFQIGSSSLHTREFDPVSLLSSRTATFWSEADKAKRRATIMNAALGMPYGSSSISRNVYKDWLNHGYLDAARNEKRKCKIERTAQRLWQGRNVQAHKKGKKLTDMSRQCQDMYHDYAERFLGYKE